jgi:SusD family.
MLLTKALIWLEQPILLSHERQIELVFEGQRWFDIRRWMIIEDIYSKPVTGMIIWKHSDGSKTYELNPEPIEYRTFHDA